MSTPAAPPPGGAPVRPRPRSAAHLLAPPARRDDVVDDYHGVRVADPYRWLEDPDSDETRAWVQAQNAHTRAWLDADAELLAAQRRLLAERWDHPRAGAPWRRGQRWFQLRNTGLQDQDVLWVMDGPEDEGRVLLDPNVLSAEGTVSLAAAVPSPDGELLAYATSAAGSDWMTWRVRRIADGHDLDDVLQWAKFSSAAWLPDATAFAYARYDAPPRGRMHEAANRGQRLHLHVLGTPQDDDAVLYARPDEPEWGFDPVVSEDGRWLVVSVWQGTDPRNRVALADLAGDGVVRMLIEDLEAQYAFLGNDGEALYFRTDLDAPRGRVVAVDARDGSVLREVVPELDEALETVRLVGGALVAVTLADAAHRVRCFDLDGRERAEVPLPGLATVGSLTGRRDDDVVHLTVTTFTTPVSVLAHDLRDATTRQLVAPGLPVDEGRFRAERVFVASADGTRVPLFLVRRSDVTPDGARPTLLYGYGGFRISITPQFRTPWLVWLEQGGVLAVACLRGGGEYGQAWHDAGRLERKQNTFDDAAACARWLVDEGWTRPDRLAVSGGSNGGLLVGATITQHPQLVGAAVCEVGVLDLLRYHRWTIGWAWASDYGTVDDPDQLRRLLAWSPLHNVRAGVPYPATLLTTGDHDDRVVPAHSYKFAAALQAAQAGVAPVLLRVDTDAGHGAGKPTGKLIDERADVLAFLWKALRASPDLGATERLARGR